MKKFISITLILCLVLGCLTVPCSALSKKNKKKKKYVKVKSATYQMYKRAYNENADLKATIANQQAEINNLRASNNTEALSAELTQAKADLAQAKADLESANSMNSWVWMNLKSLGITYNSKTWTIPSAYPESFMVDGVKYVVVVPEVETPEGGE